MKSIYSPRFLVQLYQEKLKLDRMDILKIRYEKTRVDCNYIEKEYGPDLLQEGIKNSNLWLTSVRQSIKLITNQREKINERK